MKLLFQNTGLLTTSDVEMSYKKTKSHTPVLHQMLKTNFITYRFSTSKGNQRLS